MSIVDLPVMKASDSGRGRSARICSFVTATRANTFVFVQCYYISISHVPRNCSLLPAREEVQHARDVVVEVFRVLCLRVV